MEIPPEYDTAYLVEESRRQHRIRFHRPSKWHLALILAAALTISGSIWWFDRPSQSVSLPPNTCWGELTQADYSILAGRSGKATPVNDGSIDYAIGDAPVECGLMWSTQRIGGMLAVEINRGNGTGYDNAQFEMTTRKAGTPHPVNFGPEIEGWYGDGNRSATLLYLRCDYPGATDPNPVVAITVTGAIGLSAAPRAEVRQAYADISLKIAKAIARRIPCKNNVPLPDKAPILPPM
ncbi:hypothetical protein [Kitasatospora acidiphila]|uniref:hypothetical protein n=1 Tax=Kitasatospora acidiphila TaxID=2567942 RepID=UPI003C760AFD